MSGLSSPLLIAITISAASSGHLEIAVGNLLGGVAIQTLVLVVLDASVTGDRPLTYLVGSLIPVEEAILVTALVVLTLMGAALPRSAAIAGMSPVSAAVVTLWVAGIAILDRTGSRSAGRRTLRRASRDGLTSG